MVNKLERLIRSEAATVANQGSYQVRESDVEALETLRKEAGLNKQDIDDLLDELRNWYSNHQRPGGTHEFSRPDYIRIRDMLEVEYLRDRVGFTENDVSRGINNSAGWYEEQIKGGFKIDDYNKIVVFFIAAAVLQNRYGGLDDDKINELIEFGLVNKGVIEDLRESIDIDYKS